MRKITVLFVSVLFMSTGLLVAQDAQEIFKTEFPELDSVNFQNDNALNNEAVAKYRMQYHKLKESAKELKTFKFGGATEDNLKIFNYKELKSLEKDNQIPKLEGMLKSNIQDMKQYLADKTQYGADSIECIEQSSILKTLINSKDYEHAYTPWKLLFNYYPISSKNIYLWGEEMLEEKIEGSLKEAKATQIEAKKIIEDAEPLKETDVKKYNAEIEKANEKMSNIKAILEVRDQWVDTLMMLFDQRIEYYGDDSKQYGEGYIIGKKGIALYKYQKSEKLEEAYKYLKESAKMQADYPSLAGLQYFFFASDEMYQKEKIEPEVVVEDYTLCQDILAKYIEKLNDLYNQRQEDKYLKVIESAQSVADNITDKFTSGEYAQCDVLVPAFDKKFEENKEDVKWLKKTISILSNRKGEDSDKCVKSELYEKAIIQLYNLEPSALAAYNLAQFYLKKEPADYDNAAKYYEQACNLAEDPLKKAEYYYDAAVIASVKGQLSKSRDLAQSALDFNPNLGKAYILIGKLYVKSVNSCGENNFEKSQVYWLAADMMNKAKSADQSVSDEASSLAGEYSKKFPRKEDAFMYSVKPGDTVTIGCWIQRSTTARFIQ